MQIFNRMLSYKQPVSKYTDLSLTVKCWIHLEELIISTNTKSFYSLFKGGNPTIY